MNSLLGTPWTGKIALDVMLDMEAAMKSSPDEKTINSLCLKCLRSCKQPAANLLLECPRYFPLPFKVDKHRFDQMSLFDGDE